MKHVLTVEDETVIRAALKRLLERNGYLVSEAGSVQEACDNHDLESFDLIISDLRLPGAPGTDLITKAGSAPVLIMTSYASLRSAVERDANRWSRQDNPAVDTRGRTSRMPGRPPKRRRSGAASSADHPRAARRRERP